MLLEVHIIGTDLNTNCSKEDSHSRFKIRLKVGTNPIIIGFTFKWDFKNVKKLHQIWHFH